MGGLIAGEGIENVVYVAGEYKASYDTNQAAWESILAQAEELGGYTKLPDNIYIGVLLLLRENVVDVVQTGKVVLYFDETGMPQLKYIEDWTGDGHLMGLKMRDDWYERLAQKQALELFKKMGEDNE